MLAKYTGVKVADYRRIRKGWAHSARQVENVLHFFVVTEILNSVKHKRRLADLGERQIRDQ